MCLTDIKVVYISKTHRDDKCKKKTIFHVRNVNAEEIFTSTLQMSECFITYVISGLRYSLFLDVTQGILGVTDVLG